jgi:DNA-directed RNA polymerase subunit alpha
MAVVMNFKNLMKPPKLKPSGDITSRHGKFIAEPYPKGFGTTVGNALKRVLLSSVEGSAVVGVKIAGAKNSAVPGVKEDLTEIILNIKQLELLLSSDTMQGVHIRKKGAGALKAADIDGGQYLTVLNPQQHILTIQGDAEVEIELYVKRGFGYVPGEETKFKDSGIIPVDALFTPIKRANYTVEKTRAEASANFDADRLIIEVSTDGSIKPEDAVAFSAGAIRDIFSVFINFDEEEEDEQPEEPKSNEKFIEILTRSIEELELSVRSSNCLKNARIKTIGELCERSEAELLKTKNFGKKSLEEIKKVLNGLGLKLGLESADTQNNSKEEE